MINYNKRQALTVVEYLAEGQGHRKATKGRAAAGASKFMFQFISIKTKLTLNATFCLNALS